ncbi:MAG TPA: glycosyltransferase family 39 protein [Vicinamibacteria bacterium]|nr:glycosyltransferase family 39 protein [Vicinamibacteria bacterium]
MAWLAPAGLVLSGLGLLDPRLRLLLWLGPALAGLGLFVRQSRSRRLCAGLSLAFALCGWSGPEFRADAGSYLVYLRSLAFDHDLDFANDWALLGYPKATASRTATGLLPNAQSVGPAILWSPFYALAHVYVRATGALGLAAWPADGVSGPYRRASALGTVTGVVVGLFLLQRALATAFTPGVAFLATAVAFLSSPAVYYTFVVPGMAHGLAFALAAALIFALGRARDSPSTGAWLLVGALVGLLVLVRTQAAVMALLVLLPALVAWRKREVRPQTLLLAAALALAVVTPQLVAWKVLFGSYVTLPQGRGYLDWSSPHLRDVLFSANHGLFVWSPALLVGFVGLLLHLRRDPVLAGGALLAFAAVAWTNGAVSGRDWDGDDAFGARRFEVAAALLAVGLATVAAAAQSLAVRRPWLLPAALLVPFVLWNLGFLSVFRAGGYPDAAPLDRVARDQALLLRRLATRALGPSVFESLAGEYVFGVIAPRGALSLAQADDRTIGAGFTPPAWREGGPAFRWALHPEACLTLPLRRDEHVEAVGLRLRAPRRALPQELTLVLNGLDLGRASLSADWTWLRFTVPATAFGPGENHLCLRFARGIPGEHGPAAAVAEVRLARRPEELGSDGAAEAVDQEVGQAREEQ